MPSQVLEAMRPSAPLAARHIPDLARSPTRTWLALISFSSARLMAHVGRPTATEGAGTLQTVGMAPLALPRARALRSVPNARPASGWHYPQAV